MKMESYKSQSGLDKLTNSGPCLTVILKKSLLGVPFFLEKLSTLTEYSPFERNCPCNILAAVDTKLHQSD